MLFRVRQKGLPIVGPGSERQNARHALSPHSGDLVAVRPNDCVDRPRTTPTLFNRCDARSAAHFVRLVAQQLKGETLSAMRPNVPVPAPPSAHRMRRAANVRPVLVPENRKVPARGCISGRANRQDIVGLGRPNRNEGAVGQPGDAREAS